MTRDHEICVRVAPGVSQYVLIGIDEVEAEPRRAITDRTGFEQRRNLRVGLVPSSGPDKGFDIIVDDACPIAIAGKRAFVSGEGSLIVPII
jgi:hypothetical protein